MCTSCKRVVKLDTVQCPTDGAATEIVATLPQNARLGAYKIDRMLGEGGMGFVYEATHEVLNRRSAIKMLRPELANQAQIVTRFLNEAKAVNLIDHQHIVNVYDYGDSQDGSVYFVMEFLEGETLDDLMRKRRPMQLPLLLHVFGQIAKALAAAHAKQIVHRDLKPANVYVIAREDNPYFIKLLDFGIAQLRGQGAVAGLTLVGSVMGTPQYLSPEQISGGTVDARSDVWAMGVMMYRAATGEAPYKGEEFAELADKILHTVPRPANELVVMPAELAQLIASCLARRIEDRCASIAELIAGLGRVKQASKLDDDAILAAVKADSGAIRERLPARRRELTRDSIAGSLPKFQDQRGPAIAATPAAPPTRRGLYLAIGALAVAGGVAAYLVRGAGTAGAVAPGPGPVTEQASPQPQKSIEDLVMAGDLGNARALAERQLREAISSTSQQQQGLAVDALARAHVPAGAPLLYLALQGSPDVRVKAARALCDLHLPDAAPKVRAALAASGEPVKVEIAAALSCLGDAEGQAILTHGLAEPRTRLTAALALAAAGDAAGRAALVEIMMTLPAGREQWRLATGALVKLGDTSAHKQLEAELPQADAARAIAAAELLARAGDAPAKDQLARNATDPDHARRGAAAAALARLGDPRALGWVGDGLASSDAQLDALAICGQLAVAAKYAAAIARLATHDPDPRVIMTAEAVLLGL
ncbi:MAG: protein kinase [Kofleriaceae bacterium]